MESLTYKRNSIEWRHHMNWVQEIIELRKCGVPYQAIQEMFKEKYNVSVTNEMLRGAYNRYKDSYKKTEGADKEKKVLFAEHVMNGNEASKDLPKQESSKKEEPPEYNISIEIVNEGEKSKMRTTLLFIFKVFRILFICLIAYGIDRYFGRDWALLFGFAFILHEIWEVNMAIAEVESNSRKKEDDDIGRILERAKDLTKR